MTDSSFAAIKEVEKERRVDDLMRRLQVIKVAPPKAAVTVEILRTRGPSIAEHFGVGIDDDALVRAVELGYPRADAAAADEFAVLRGQPAFERLFGR